MISTEATAIELLAPARNLECGIAAIDHGADAVYIGAPRFGARAAAGNSVEDIAALCRYARQFGVRVYVTVNTILYDDELQTVRDLVWELYRAGADALIVQDLALLQMDLPPIALHASTQMDNRSADKVEWLRSLGFRQVVLARELTLQDIAAIHRAVPAMPLEAFCHGALCVSYSGQCYASQYCFGRSANRGECAQFCRLPFTLQDAQGRTLASDRHLLSLCDMNRSQWLEQMMDAGVCSFKIEGRLKDVSYVKNVTAHYRQQIDAILRRRPEYVRSSFGCETFTFQPDPARSFSRGFTDYFLHGRRAGMSSPVTPKSRGPLVGTVKEVRRNSLIVSGTTAFHNGDGLCYVNGQGGLSGFRVNRVQDNQVFPAQMPDVRPRTQLYRSYDHEWERMLGGKTADRRIAVKWLLRDTPSGFRLKAEREDGMQQELQANLAHEIAQSDQSRVIADVLSKTGNTPYMSAGVTVEFSKSWFIPRSILAEWRRTLLQELGGLPLRSRKTEIIDKGTTTSQGRPVESPEKVGPVRYALPTSYQANVSNRMARRFYAEQGVGEVDIAMELSPDSFREGGGILMQCRFCLKYERGWCPCLHPREPVPPEPYSLIAPNGRRFRLHFDCRRCEMSVLAG